jgi:DNA repair exonuclease SbcCD ATPase subunit
MIKHIKTQNTKQRLYRMSMFMALLCCATSFAAQNERDAWNLEPQQPNTRHVPLGPEYIRARIAELQEQNNIMQLSLGELSHALISNRGHNAMIEERVAQLDDMCETIAKQNYEMHKEKLEMLFKANEELNEAFKSIEELVKEVNKLSQQLSEQTEKVEKLLIQFNQELRPYLALKSCLYFPFSSLSRLAQKICG